MIKVIAFISLVLTHSSYQEAAYLDRKQVFCLATAVHHEARGEPSTGQIAVAYNVLHRVQNDGFPDTVCDVVYQPSQYSYIEAASPDYRSDAWERAVESAVFAMLGITDDPTQGALYFYNPEIVPVPAWAEPEWEIQIGNHVFFNVADSR